MTAPTSGPVPYTAGTITAPALDCFAIVPSDTANHPIVARAIYIGGAGNIALVPPKGGSAITFVGVVAGDILPVMSQRVNSTNTTATNLVGLV